MCGIGGIVAFSPDRRVDRSDLVTLRDRQQHRGPDASGVWLADSGRQGLVHTRLAIIDLNPRAHQPMTSEDGRLRIVFNGEIYNYRALREELGAAGQRFLSTSDTEVILAGYRAWGPQVVGRLRGMFAFAILDAERDELFLARDPLGIKPLYTAREEDRFAFASEVRALRSIGVGGELDPDALTTYLLWGSIPSPATIHRGIRSLAPGTHMTVSGDGSIRTEAYDRLEDHFGRARDFDETESAARVRDALLDSVEAHLVADVPVGAFLSGGVDSSALVGLMSEAHDGPIETVTLAFDVPDLDESRLASEASQVYGTRHHEIRIGLDDVKRVLHSAVDAMDQPTIDGVNTYFVAEATARAGLKVAVSGVGGDELFGGYSTFDWLDSIRRTHGRLSRLPGIGSGARAVARLLESRPLPRRSAKIVRALVHGNNPWGAYYASRGLFSPHEVRELLSPDWVGDLHPNPAGWLSERIDLEEVPADEHASLLEFGQYLRSQLLRDTDAASMAHSLEVRTPLVDRELLRAVNRIPARHRFSGPAKRLLRQAPKTPVPDALWNRRKQGFTMPFDHWLRSGEVEMSVPRHPALRPEAVRAVEEGFRRGRFHYSRLWALLVLQRFIG